MRIVNRTQLRLALFTVTVGELLLGCARVAGQILTPPPNYRTVSVLTPGPVPQNISITGTPAAAQLTWTVPVSPRGVFYAVKRWMESDLACCNTQVSGLRVSGWLDESVQWAGTYVYRVTAFYPDGTVGSVDARWVRPDPVNPTNFRAVLKRTVLDPSYLQPTLFAAGYPGVHAGSPGASTQGALLIWDAVAGASWYQLFGPGLPGGSYQVWPNTTGGQALEIAGLPPGTYTWRIGSYYSSPKAPAPVSSPAAAFPQVSITLPD